MISYRPPVSGSGSASPAGSNGEVQYNDNGNFGADSHFVWDASEKAMVLSEDSVTRTAVEGKVKMFGISRQVGSNPTSSGFGIVGPGGQDGKGYFGGKLAVGHLDPRRDIDIKKNFNAPVGSMIENENTGTEAEVRYWLVSGNKNFYMLLTPSGFLPANYTPASYEGPDRSSLISDAGNGASIVSLNGGFRLLTGGDYSRIRVSHDGKLFLVANEAANSDVASGEVNLFLESGELKFKANDAGTIREYALAEA